jgi:hypothetical protein
MCLLHNRRSECMPASNKLFHPQLSTFLLNSTSVQLSNSKIGQHRSQEVRIRPQYTPYFKTTSATTSTRPCTRDGRTSNPASTGRFMLPRLTKSKRRLPPVRYTAWITRWLRSSSPTRATSTTAMARPVNTRGQRCPHQPTTRRVPAQLFQQ